MSQAEDIKIKLDIVEVIREYIPVKAVGANFQAICPFHNEKSPSFVISPDKQIWHCFGCGRGGDVFSFVMEKEGLGFMEAMRLLAPKAGVTLKNENPEEYSKRNRILDILELTGKYYAYNLKNSANKNALNYLNKRALKEETINEWQLGYSPDAWDSLYKFLKARPLSGQKFTDEEMFLAGVIIKKDPSRSQGGYYDRFRDRIMFPIWDVNNNLIAFTARVNPEKEATEKMGKYINSPQSAVYDKSRVLFALNKAKTAIRKADLAIVVEGQMDAISCHQAGFTNVVASSGTALTREQVTLLKRFTTNIALSFDMDDAGQMAADRGIKEVLAQEMNLKIIVLPYGKDPDECLKNNPADFKKAVEEAKPMLEYYFNKISDGLDLSELDNKHLVSTKMLDMIKLVVNNVERDYWLKKIAADLDISEIILREKLEKILSTATNNYSETTRNNPSGKGEKMPAQNLSREEKLSELLLSLLIKFPDFLSYTISNLEPDLLAGEENIGFYKSLIIYYNKVALLEYSAFHTYLTEMGNNSEKLLEKLILLGEKDFYDYEETQVKSEIIKTIVELKKYSYQKNIKKIEKLLLESEKKGDSNETLRLMDELKRLTDEIKKINLN
jgi:DNA primase